VTLASEAVGDEAVVVGSVGEPPEGATADSSTTTTTVEEPTTLPAPPTEAAPAPDTPGSGDAPTTTASSSTEPDPLPTVAMIGDSVLAGAQAAVDEAIDNPLVIDATVNRQFKHAASVVADLRASGTLGSVVVIHLGTNGAFSDAAFDAVMASVSDVDRVILVTAKVPRRWEERVNAAIAAGAQRHPSVVILDWHAIAAPHPEWFRDDQVHLNRDGMAAYGEALDRAING